MINNDIDPQSLLSQLGERLKQSRLARNESQELFVSRHGITRQSYARMEKGAPTTSDGTKVQAGEIVVADPDVQGRLRGQFRYSQVFLEFLKIVFLMIGSENHGSSLWPEAE